MPEPGIVVTAAAPAPSTRIAPPARAGISGVPATAAMNPASILRALRRRSALALGAAILLSGFCGPAACFLVPPGKFKAQAQLQVVAAPPKVLFRTDETEVLNGEEYSRYQNTQQTLVKSQMVLNAALQEPKVGDYQVILRPDRSGRVAPEHAGRRFPRGVRGDGDLAERRRSD